MAQEKRNAQAAKLITLDRKWSANVADLVRSREMLYGACVIFAHAGDGLLCLAGGLVVFLVGSASYRMSVLQIAAAVVLTAVFVVGTKFVVRRKRPRGVDIARWSAMPVHDAYSFPSGHAARAVCIAVGISTLFPSLTLPSAIWAGGVCFARVAVGAHYTLDVVAGMVMGALAAVVAAKAWPTLVFWCQELLF
ncbi:MAG: hypothetical protein A2Y73_04675 [Chloroflexi bacterium RBG_13_56_8]|nr:MAG: hypothetical protein A2Y73_04675 [Chloroflexi bacterium RBG_13_56_8]